MNKGKMSKRLTIIFSIIVFVVVLVILGSTIFSVKEIRVEYPIVNNFSAKDVELAASTVLNMNIFRVSKEKTAISVEQAVPYAKVKSIEKKFPNIILIKTDIRIGLIAVPISKANETTFSHYVIIDEDMKVLEVLEVTNSKIQNYTMLVGLPFASDLVNIEDLAGNHIEAIGDFLILKNIIKTIKSLNTSISGYGFSEFFRFIDFDHGRDEDKVYFILRNSQTAFSISKNNITTDLQYALSSF